MELCYLVQDSLNLVFKIFVTSICLLNNHHHSANVRGRILIIFKFSEGLKILRDRSLESVTYFSGSVRYLSAMTNPKYVVYLLTRYTHCIKEPRTRNQEPGTRNQEPRSLLLLRYFSSIVSSPLVYPEGPGHRLSTVPPVYCFSPPQSVNIC